MMPQWPIPIKGMIIVSSFSIHYNSELGSHSIRPTRDSICPQCGGALKYRDSRKRGVKNLFGEARCFFLRRLRCTVCGRFHTEIPDIILPYKRYDAETIQSVLDGEESATACAADDSTMHRWRASFAEAEADMGQRIASVYACEEDALVPIVSGVDVIAHIRSAKPRWLPFVMKLLIMAGHVPCTRFAFCPDTCAVKVKATDITVAKGGAKNDKIVNDTG
jgi:hypothetical protein